MGSARHLRGDSSALTLIARADSRHPGAGAHRAERHSLCTPWNTNLHGIERRRGWLPKRAGTLMHTCHANARQAIADASARAAPVPHLSSVPLMARMPLLRYRSDPRFCGARAEATGPACWATLAKNDASARAFFRYPLLRQLATPGLA